MSRLLPIGIAVLALAFGAFWLLASAPEAPDRQVLEDLPWQVQLREDGGSRVLGLELGQASLADAAALYGPPDGAGLFQGERGRSLEAYFGVVRIAGLEGRLVVTLAATQDELAGAAAGAVGAERVASGATRFTLSPEDKETLSGRRITGISYLPRYKGLEAGFFRERLGEPAAWRQIDEGSVEWFYPRLGLVLVLSSKDGAVFEYVPPREFALPADVTLAEP